MNSKKDINFLIKRIKYGFEGKNFIPNFDIYRPKQVHSTKIIELTENTINKLKMPNIEYEADGIYTTLRGFHIGVVTADCAPILITDINQNIIMALHAGWRGLCAGIVNNGIKILLDHNINPSHIIVLIGPTICFKCYEVGVDVINAFNIEFLNITHKQFESCVAKKHNKKYLLNINGIIKNILLSYNIINIYNYETCTFENPNYYSYRKDGKVVGKNYSWICI